jgi:hypothetical protein
MFCNHNVSRDGSSFVIRWNLLCWVRSIELASIGGPLINLSVFHLVALFAQLIHSQMPKTKWCPIFPHLHLGPHSGLFPSGFPTKILYTFLMCSKRATCPAYPILLGLVILMIFCEEHKLLINCIFFSPLCFLSLRRKYPYRTSLPSG